jgi:arsenic resistance protein ArsH
MQDTLPNVHADLIDIPSLEQLEPRTPSLHKPRILLLYG